MGAAVADVGRPAPRPRRRCKRLSRRQLRRDGRHVSVAADGSDLRVERIVATVDCGLALNPLGVEGQTESGIAWGLSATLLGKIDFKSGAAVQSTYQDFRVLRMNQMPALDIQILDSRAMPGGYGEHPVPPVAPAVANAVFAATGKRIRALPITPDKIRG